MELYKYQKEILESVKDKKAVAFFMEAGTGKTITSLHKYRDSPTKRLLIICLASKVNEWVEDCELLFPKTSICALNKGRDTNKKLLQEGHPIYIISFQSLLNIDKEMILRLNNDWSIIIDESQYIKNYRSKISKLCHKLSEKTEYKMILTGTPQNKGYIDYFSQLKFLGITNYITHFMNEFCVMETQTFGGGPSFKVITGYQNTKKLDKMIHDNSVFFKRTRDVEELPTQQYIRFERNKFYNKFKKDRVYEDVICPNGGVLRLRLRQICGGSINQHRFTSEKEHWIKEFIENTYDKIVIFYNFDEEAKILQEIVEKSGRPLSIYNGKTKDIDNFQDKDDAVILVNYKSGGTGINWLKSAYIGVFYSPPESYLEFEQARKRLDRIGQERVPMFYCLVTNKTVEEAIYNSIEKKEDFDDRKFNEYLERGD